MAQVPVAVFLARQKTSQLGESVDVNVAFEFHDRIKRYPVIVPSPRIELRVKIGRAHV